MKGNENFPPKSSVSVFLSRLNFAPAIGGWGQDRPGGGLGRARDASWMRFSFLLALLTRRRSGPGAPTLWRVRSYVPRYVRPAGATGQGQPLARVVPTHLATPASIHTLQRIELAKKASKRSPNGEEACYETDTFWTLT